MADGVRNPKMPFFSGGAAAEDLAEPAALRGMRRHTGKRNPARHSIRRAIICPRDYANRPSGRSRRIDTLGGAFKAVCPHRCCAKALADVRVRRAIAHSINRKEIVSQVLAGGKAAILLNSPCIPSQIGCRVTNAPAEFNVAKAKALLKEAGYEKGFALRLTGTKEAASLREAVVGYMRKVGIKATAQSLPIVSYRKLRGQGKIAGLLNIYGSGGIPDVAKVFDFYWQGPKHRNDYHHDPVLFKTRKAAATTFDKKARDAMFLKAFNHNNDQVYVIPFASAPTVLVHTKDLDIPYDFSTNAYGLDLSNAHWKK